MCFICCSIRTTNLQAMFGVLLYLSIAVGSNEEKPEHHETYKKAAVTTEVPLCSDLGVDIMRLDGNAVDAAVASAICVGIINSFSSGLGGGGFMLIKLPGNQNEIVTVDFRETAPYNVNLQDYKTKKDMSKKGGSAIAVPGEVKGLHYAHSKYGKLPWKLLLEKNAAIADNFEVSDQLHRRLKKLKKFILRDAGLNEIYTQNGDIVQPGTMIQRANYAQTLRKLALNPESFYSGDIAEQIVAAVQSQGGRLTMQDMQKYEVKTPKPLQSTYKDSIVFTTNLPTAGPLVIEALNILESFDLKELRDIGTEHGIFPEYHLLVEIFKFMSAKRSELGDPEFVPEAQEVAEELISKEHAKKVSETIKFDRTLSMEEYGYEIPPTNDHGTTHLNTYDEQGMIVLLTSTINLEFGAKYMDQVTGIVFNNEIDDFYVPFVKNAFDLPESQANIIKPGKRPFSSAAPVLLIKSNQIVALGAAGGTRIPTSIISAVFHLELGKTLAEAVAEPRLHHQMIPYVTYVEYNLNHDIVNYLSKIGNEVKESSTNSIFTSVQGMVIRRDPEMVVEAYSDRRKGGVSAGY
ncbi:gamma-glutamyltransferase [Vavraia culicis subsp. floridensis]|uniref:Glutathione hydrolase n=1 Tax=Vavraia culicis (isolate floridensis) TaxID=948595 RepID=L2GY27_VAVCU|nr:gamma-glutamyltransferase [Vavraia culicis subsp. floridensis]ELA48262.1 gamma-glutamyltransferase [Vavraia culicis subsp. floridensis]